MAKDRIFKTYVAAQGKKVNNLRIELYYSLGGFSYWTYKTEPRGYYLSVSPVELSEQVLSDGTKYGTESCVLGDGVKELILEVQRKSDKAAIKAKEMAIPEIQKLVDYVCAKYNVELIGKVEIE